MVTLVARFFEGILDGVTLCVGGATEAVVADGDDTVVVGLFEPTGVVLGPVPACVAQLARTMAVIVAAKPASIRLMFAPFARLLSARAVTLLIGQGGEHAPQVSGEARQLLLRRRVDDV